MSVIAEVATKLERSMKSIVAIIREELIANQEFISELNRMQLAEGTRPDESILPDYAPISVIQFGKEAGPIKLFDTGEFYEGIKPMFEDDTFEMVGVDEKTEMLIMKYGEVLGLSMENRKILAQKLIPGIKSRILKLL